MDYQFWVYIIGSISGTLYIGFTNDLDRRMRNTRAASSKDLRPNMIVIACFTTRSSTTFSKPSTREKQLKGWRREKKIKLIESVNPRWQDLAETWGAKMLFANQAIRDQKP